MNKLPLKLFKTKTAIFERGKLVREKLDEFCRTYEKKKICQMQACIARPHVLCNLQHISLGPSLVMLYFYHVLDHCQDIADGHSNFQLSRWLRGTSFQESLSGLVATWLSTVHCLCLWLVTGEISMEVTAADPRLQLMIMPSRYENESEHQFLTQSIMTSKRFKIQLPNLILRRLESTINRIHRTRIIMIPNFTILSARVGEWT